MQSAPQTSIGPYRILGQIGTGRLGVVYAAQHDSLARKVAVKVLAPELTGDKDAVVRLLDEAMRASATRNPGLVQIHDVGYRDDGIAYVAMELLEGQTLRARLAEMGRLPAKQALRFAGHLASALSALHNEGIIHCVLEPSNVFVVVDATVPGGERVKLLDVGIAKLIALGNPSLVQARIGAVSSPEYLSPEQCRGAASEIDHRADLYALGCILFHMLCGQPPFVGDGKGPSSVIAAHLEVSPPQPRTLVPDLPRDIDAVINFLLAKDPDRRYPSASELGNSLAAILREPVLFSAPAGKGGQKAANLPLTPPPPTVPRMPATPMIRPPAPDATATATATATGADSSATDSDANVPTLRRRRVTVHKVDARQKPRRRWLVPALVLAVLALGGAAFAFITFGPGLLWPGGDATQTRPDVATEVAATDPVDAAPRVAEKQPPPVPHLEFVPLDGDAAADPPGDEGDAGPSIESDASTDSDASAGSAATTAPARDIVSWRISSRPPGAEVLHEGKPVGKTPLEVRVDRTPDYKTELVVHLAEHDDVTLDLSAAGSSDETVELVEQVPVDIDSRPPGAEIRDGQGRSRGITPTRVFISPRAASTTVILSHDGYEDHVLELVPGKKSRERVTLIKKRAQVTIQLDSEPSGATVSKAGKTLGTTPYTDEFLEEPRAIEYTLELDGYRKATVRVRGNRDDSKRVELRPTTKSKCRKKGPGNGPALVDPYDPC